MGGMKNRMRRCRFRRRLYFPLPFSPLLPQPFYTDDPKHAKQKKSKTKEHDAPYTISTTFGLSANQSMSTSDGPLSSKNSSETIPFLLP